jgi:hypothetical protein
LLGSDEEEIERAENNQHGKKQAQRAALLLGLRVGRTDKEIHDCLHRWEDLAGASP